MGLSSKMNNILIVAKGMVPIRSYLVRYNHRWEGGLRGLRAQFEKALRRVGRHSLRPGCSLRGLGYAIGDKSYLGMHIGIFGHSEICLSGLLKARILSEHPLDTREYRLGFPRSGSEFGNVGLMNKNSKFCHHSDFL